MTSAVVASFAELYDSVWRSGVDPALLELCRLRVAQLLGSPEGGERDPRATFSARERACLAYAERIVADAHGVSDDEVAAVRQHLSDREHAALTVAITVFESEQRTRLALAGAA